MVAEWRLSVKDCLRLKIRDAYSVHKIVYGMFDDVRTADEKRSHIASGILYYDRMGEGERVILMMSDRPPHQPTVGRLRVKTVSESFLEHERYAFEVMMNPTRRRKSDGKLVPIKGMDALAAWFSGKSERDWGFVVEAGSLSIRPLGVQVFEAKGRKVVHHRVLFSGRIRVSDRELFQKAFRTGLGRGKAFGFGMLRIAPLRGAVSDQECQ